MSGGERGRPVSAIIEARMTSTRLPGKVLMEAAGKPMLAHMIERLRRVPDLDGVIVATTTNAADEPIARLTERLAVGCWRGSEEDVRGRVLEAAAAFGVKTIVETTGDCPLIDPEIVAAVIRRYMAGTADLVANNRVITYPIGMDAIVFATDVLADAAAGFGGPLYREHVTLAITRNPDRYAIENVQAPPELADPELGLTLDTREDFALIRTVFETLYPQNPSFGLADILALVRRQPALRTLNADVRRTAV